MFIGKNALLTVAASMAAFCLVVAGSVLISAPAAFAPGDKSSGKSQAETQKVIQAALNRLPLAFEANKGQTDSRVDFLARGPGYLAFLSSTEAVLKLNGTGETVQPAALRMRLIGANAASSAKASDKLQGKVNYFLGGSPKPVRGLSTHGKVSYQGVYPGIDIAYYGNQRQLEYDFIVSPGADPGKINLKFEGADRLSLRRNGDLQIAVGDNQVVQRKPYVYQMVSGRREAIPGNFRVAGKSVGFDVGRYDRAKTLVIDPVLSYRSYLGGANVDMGFGVDVDSTGAAYVTGSTLSTNFPTVGGVLGCTGPVLLPPAPATSPTTSLQCKQPMGEAFVTKVNPGGGSLAWSTYLGGSGEDLGWDVGVDDSGNVYVAGSTESGDDPENATDVPFPTTDGAFDRKCGTDGICNAPTAGIEPLADTFLAKLGPNGDSLLYSTYLGGSDVDLDTNPAAGALPDMGIAVKGSMAYIAAATASPDFPTTVNGDQKCGTASSEAGNGCDLNNDAYLSVVDTSESGADSLVFSTYLGGDGDDQAKGVAVDSEGDAYVGGLTFGFGSNPLVGGSSLVNNFPSLSSVQAAYGGGASDGFVAKFDIGSSEISARESANAALDSAGVGGPVRGLANSTLGRSGVGRRASLGTGAMLYSTYLGGGGADEVWDVDVKGVNAFAAGYTESGDDPATPVPDGPLPYFPTTTGAFDTSYNGRPYAPDGSTAFLAGDAFVAQLTPAGNGLVYSTFLGSTSGDVGVGIDVDSTGAAYVTGYTHCETPVDHQGPEISDMQVGFPLSSNGAQRIGPATTSTTAAYAVHARAAGTNPAAVDLKDPNDPEKLEDLPAGTEVQLTAVPDPKSGKQVQFSNGSNTIKVAVNANGNASDSVTPTGTEAGIARIHAEIVTSPEGSPYAVGTIAMGVAQWGYPQPSCSGDFPVTGAPQPAIDGSFLGVELHNSPAEGFVTKLNPSGGALVYSTYAGGNDFDRGYAIAVRETSDGNEAYFTGRSGSTGIGTTGSAFPTKPSGKGNRDAYIAQIREP